MFGNPLAGAWTNLVGNAVKNTANFIDRSFSDIPFVSNPYASRPQTGSTGGGGSKPSPSTPTYAATPPPDNSWRMGMQAEIDRLRSAAAAVPKLPTYDILGNYNRAKSQAEQNVTPMYNQKLTNFLAENSSGRFGAAEGTKLVRKRGEVGFQKEGNARDRDYTREDNALTRTRTTEDVAAAIDQINRGEGEFQMDEGRTFDTDRRALQEGMAGAGLTTSGIGQQAVAEQLNERNITSERQVRQFETQRQAKQVFQTRTLQDADISDLRADEALDLKNRAADFDLESYINELAIQEQGGRQDLELWRGEQVLNQASALQSQFAREFLANLAQSGARSQDIALANQVYGNLL